jgi:small GTP-binding protein
MMRKAGSGKVVLLGSSAVGKTSIVNRAVSDTFTADEATTIGAQFSTKMVVNSDNIEITLKIWDTAGQERFRSLAPMYFQGAHFALLVFSLTDRSSLTDAKTWEAELRKHADDKRFPQLYLIGNKSDLVGQRDVTPDDAQGLAEQLGAQYFETSALSGSNIQELLADIANNVTVKETEVSSQAVALTPAATASTPSKSCC